MISISKNLSEEEITRLLSQNAYYYIQHVELTHERCLVAVKSNGSALKFIPKKIQTKEICLEAVNQCSSAVRYVSKRFLDDELYIKAANSNNPNLCYIPKKYISQVVCDNAVRKSVRAISSVPDEFLTMELRTKAIEMDWRALGWIDDKKRSKRLCMKAYRTNVEAIKNFPNRFLTKELCEEAVKIDTSVSVYVPEKYQTRSIIQALTERAEEIEKNEEKSEAEAVIEDDKFYENHVLANISLLSCTPVKKNEIIAAETILHELDSDDGYDNSIRSIYYVSDIHLNHKIHKRFPNGASELEIRSYVESVVVNMLSTMSSNEYSYFSKDFLLIAGDISFDFKISEMFYQLIAEKWESGKVIVTLGNHELWHDTSEPQSLSKILYQYSKMFEELGMNFLENDLLTLTYDIESPYGRLIKLSEDDIMHSSADDLQELCNRSSFIVFGAIGFSGLNEEFNALNGIYRKTIDSRIDEIKLSTITRKLYCKLVDSIGDYKVIIQTHMPFTDWCNDKYQPGWIYVNGHNHRNEFFISHEKTVFADNQIGYSNSNIALKRFNLTSNYDVFNNWKDGIYKINREEYLDFCKGLGINLNFNSRDGNVIMLKREGSYLFLYKKDNGKLYLLKGGMLKSLDENDVNYYYENMTTFAYAVRKVFEKYDVMLKKISDFVRTFGGSGIVHGCIIDIDFYNHIYLNPFDGSVNPYYALSIIDKWVYKDIKSLLIAHCPQLTDKFIEVTRNGTIDLEDKSSKEYAIALSEYVPETKIYNPSRIIRSFQYLREVNVIREWDDNWLNETNKRRINDTFLLLNNNIGK